MTKNLITITTGSDLPADFINEFEKQFNSVNIDVEKHQVLDDEYYNFSGQDIVDVLIALKDNSNAIFLAPALYDVAKATVIGIWNKLVKTKKEDTQTKKLTIKYSDSKNRNFKINIEGDIDPKTVDQIVEKSFEQLKADKEKMYENPDLVTLDEDVQTIVMVFNPESNSFEPVNFGKIRREMEEFQRRAEDEF